MPKAGLPKAGATELAPKAEAVEDAGVAGLPKDELPNPDAAGVAGWPKADEPNDGEAEAAAGLPNADEPKAGAALPKAGFEEVEDAPKATGLTGDGPDGVIDGDCCAAGAGSPVAISLSLVISP